MREQPSLVEQCSSNAGAEGHDEFKALTLDNRAPLHIGVVHYLCRDTEQFGECRSEVELRPRECEFRIAITGILCPRERWNFDDPTVTDEPGESD